MTRSDDDVPGSSLEWILEVVRTGDVMAIVFDDDGVVKTGDVIAIFVEAPDGNADPSRTRLRPKMYLLRLCVFLYLIILTVCGLGEGRRGGEFMFYSTALEA